MEKYALKKLFNTFSRFIMVLSPIVIPLLGALIWLLIILFAEKIVGIRIPNNIRFYGFIIFAALAYARAFWVDFRKPKDKIKFTVMLIGDTFSTDVKLFYDNINSTIYKELNEHYPNKVYIPTINRSAKYFFNFFFRNYPNSLGYKNKILDWYLKFSKSEVIVFGNACITKDNKDEAYRVSPNIYYDNSSIDEGTKTIIESMRNSRLIIHDNCEDLETLKIGKILATYIYIANSLIERSENKKPIDLDTIIEIYKKINSKDLELDSNGSFSKILENFTIFLIDNLDIKEKERAVKVLKICKLYSKMNPSNKVLEKREQKLKSIIFLYPTIAPLSP